MKRIQFLVSPKSRDSICRGWLVVEQVTILGPRWMWDLRPEDLWWFGNSMVFEFITEILIIQFPLSSDSIIGIMVPAIEFVNYQRPA